MIEWGPMTAPIHPPLSGRIFSFNAEREAIVADVVERELARKGHAEQALELAINEAALHEIARLEGGPGSDRWREIYRTLGKKALSDKEALFRSLVAEAARDIVGNFDPKVYRFATSVVPYLLSFIMKPQGPAQLPAQRLSERIQAQGETEAVRALAQKGTVILVPTHSSNLDSIVIGYALYQLGLPPFTYGAGKNLFSNFLLTYFMNNLGAYKVDRRLGYALYKDVLKAYSTVILERGYHSLFFPGGGRCRSNAIESRLKLGLVGTGLAAYINNLRANKPQPDLFVVPATLNYHLVLEAETLIDDQLQRVGRSRYIIEDDESTQAGRIWSFANQMLRLDTSMVIRFGTPLDCFGNPVGADGVSRDRRGRPVDRRTYVLRDGEPRHQPQRDAEYTRELGQVIAESYRTNTVVLVTHLVAFALYQLFQQSHPGMDVFRLLRLPEDPVFNVRTVLETIDRLRERLQRMAEHGVLVLGREVQTATSATLLDMALPIFSLYHTRPLAVREGDDVVLTDRMLLLYYHNRLTGYGLEEVVAPERVLA